MVRREVNDTRNLCGYRNVLCLKCINANILIVILNYYFAKYYHLGRLSKEYMKSLYIVSYSRIFRIILKKKNFI